MSMDISPIQAFRDAAIKAVIENLDETRLLNQATQTIETKSYLTKTGLSALESAALQLAQQIGADTIGADEAPKPKPRSKDFHTRRGTCWACYEEDYCTHEIRDILRTEQRVTLTRLTGQGGSHE